MNKEKLKWLPLFWEKIGRDDVFGLAAQLAFFFLLSIFPLLIFLVTLLSYLPVTQDDLLVLIGDFVPNETMEFIEANLNEIMSKQSGKLLSFGIIGTIWSASNGLNAILRAFNRAYEVEESRSFIVTRGIAILFTFGMIIVLLLALILHVFGKQLGLYLYMLLNMPFKFIDFWNFIRWILSSFVIFSIFVLIYWIGPNMKIKWIDAVPGAIFATITIAFVSFGFSYYVNNFGNYSATYGSIGAVIVLMIWFYLLGIVILLGGEINSINSKVKNNC